MVFCYYFWLDPECELDRKIVEGLWKYSTRLKQWYTKYERKQAESADLESIEQLKGAYDSYVKSQVI